MRKNLYLTLQHINLQDQRYRKCEHTLEFLCFGQEEGLRHKCPLSLKMLAANEDILNILANIFKVRYHYTQSFIYP